MDERELRHELANLQANYNLMTYLIRNDKVSGQQKEDMARQVKEISARIRELEATLPPGEGSSGE